MAALTQQEKLASAVFSGDPEQVRKLSAGIDINAPFCKGRPPLLAAAELYRKSCNDGTPARKRFRQTVMALIENGADVNVHGGTSKSTLLHEYLKTDKFDTAYAPQELDYDFLRDLKDAGADFSAQDEFKCTPLMRYIDYDHWKNRDTETLKWLISVSNTEDEDWRGCTALFHITDKLEISVIVEQCRYAPEAIDCAKALFDAGANSSHADFTGCRALFNAAHGCITAGRDFSVVTDFVALGCTKDDVDATTAMLHKYREEDPTFDPPELDALFAEAARKGLEKKR